MELTEATPIEVRFLLRLREERRFPSAEMLKAQILQDVGRAQKYFRRTFEPNAERPAPRMRS